MQITFETGIKSRTLFSLSAMLLLASAATANNEVITLPPGVSQTVLDADTAASLVAGCPENDWNCLDVAIGGQDMQAIMPRYFQPDVLDSTPEMLELARVVAPILLASNGALGSGLADNSVFGVEMKLLNDDPNLPADAGDRLAITATLIASTGETLGTVYAFDEPQYGARLAALNTTGQNMVWTSNLGHGDFQGAKSVWIAGDDNSVNGSLKANGAFRITGDNHCIDGNMTYATQLTIQFGSHALGPQVQQPAASLAPTPHTAAWYQSNADHSFTGDVSILDDGAGGMRLGDGTPISGLVYASGQISIEGNDIDSNATFVAGTGVEVIGNRVKLTPAIDQVFAYSLGTVAADGISVSGSEGLLVGSMHAPNARIVINGSSNEVFGSMHANRIRVAGMGNSFSNRF